MPLSKKTVTRREFLGLFAMGVAGAGMLAACQPQSASEPTSASSGSGTAATPVPQSPTAAPKQVLKLRSSIWGDVNDQDIWDAIAADFNAAHDDIQFTCEQYIEQEGTGSYYDKVKAGIAAGNAPDALYMQGFIWGPYADKNLLALLDDYRAKDQFDSAWPDVENYHYNTKWHDKLYLCPVNTGSVIMFYNKDVFDLFGVPYPQDGWTYEDFKAIVPKLSDTKDGTKYYGYSNAGGWNGIYARALHWIRKDGVLEWDRIVEPKEAKFTQPEIVEGLQFTICDAVANEWCPSPSAVAGGGLTIGTGTVAMTPEGPWYLANMWGPKAEAGGGVNFDVVEMPVGKSGKDETVAEIGGFTINSATKYPDAVWEWLKWNASDSAQTHVAEGGRMCHTPDTIGRIWVPLAQKTFNLANAQAFANAMNTGGSPLINGAGADLDAMMLTGTPLGEAWDAMIGGQMSAQEALAMANPKCQQLLDDYWAKKGS